MTNTIPGGAYRLPDGTWVNAQGKRIPAPKELPPVVPEEEQELELEKKERTLQASGVDEYSDAPELIAEKPASRRRSKKSGDD